MVQNVCILCEENVPLHIQSDGKMWGIGSPGSRSYIQKIFYDHSEKRGKILYAFLLFIEIIFIYSAIALQSVQLDDHI